jgi:hypothetical protein
VGNEVENAGLNISSGIQMSLEMFMIHILRVQIIILRQPAAKDQLSRCFELIYSAKLGSVGNVQQGEVGL